MPRLVLRSAIMALFVIVGAYPSILEPPQRLPVPLYGFSYERPRDWHIRLSPTENLPVVVNRPWPEMESLQALPRGRAMIEMISWDATLRRRGDETLSGWARFNRESAVGQTVRTLSLAPPPSSEISEVLLSSFDRTAYATNEPQQHETGLYWTYRHKMFAAVMTYAVGDKRSANYERVLRRMVFSIRPISRH